MKPNILGLGLCFFWLVSFSLLWTFITVTLLGLHFPFVVNFVAGMFFGLVAVYLTYFSGLSLLK